MITTAFIIFLGIVWFRWFLILILVLVDVFLCENSQKPHQENKNINLSEVTILIPAYQEESTITSTIKNIQCLLDHGASLVIVDDGSSDKTAALIQQQIRNPDNTIYIRHVKNKGKAAALNSGLETIKTPFVLTLDADTHVTAAAVHSAFTKISQSDQVSVVAFDVSVKPSNFLFRELQAIEYDAALNFERRGQSLISAISVAPGAASLWRVSCLENIGGFSNKTVTEDVDATLKLASLGFKAIQTPLAQAFTGTPMTFKQLMLQRRRWCLGHYQCIPRHFRNLGKNLTFTLITYPNFFFLSAFTPIMLVMSILVLLTDFSAWRGTVGLLTVLWLCSVYIQRAIALRIAQRKTTWKAFLIEPFSTTIIHLLAMLFSAYTLIKQVTGKEIDIWANRIR